MRLIYTDEAGTAGNEPVCVVASVIVEGDKQLPSLKKAIDRIVADRVPDELQRDFYFHATDIYNGKKIDRSVWPFRERLAFLKEFLSLTIVQSIPVAVGVQFKDQLHDDLANDGREEEQGPKKRLSRDQWAHILAFNDAMERSDAFIRKYLTGSEVGMVVGEDVPDMRRLLTHGGLFHRDTPFVMKAEWQRPNQWQKELNITPNEHEYRIDHIIDVPHFVEKRCAPILQLADACAFSFRRCLSRQKHGDELLLAMLGSLDGPAFLRTEAWFSGTSSGLFNTVAHWKAEHWEFQNRMRRASREKQAKGRTP